MTESKELYFTGDINLDRIFARVAERLDILEGLRPDLSAGLYLLESDKNLTTTTDGSDNWQSAYTASLGLGSISTQDASAVTITGGTIAGDATTDVILRDVFVVIRDAHNQEIHQFPIEILAAAYTQFV